MFNVTVIDGKKILKCIITVLIIVIISVFLNKSKNKETIKQSMASTSREIYSHSFVNSMNTEIASMRYLNSSSNQNQTNLKSSIINNILSSELSASNRIIAKNTYHEEELSIDSNTQDNTPIINAEIPDNIVTEVVEDKNIAATYTNTYESVEIKNKSGYDLTNEMLIPDISLENKKDIVIFHTHACESYTPSEKFNYQMTGNYRTTDLNYNVTRVGTELEGLLKSRGYNVIHDITLHDFPSYSGSYGNSMQTVSNILSNNSAQMLIDLHRDAVGSGSEYGPTVKINDEVVAQLMIVVGTDAGGLEHPNWRENLKFAVKLQQKANELYPGLFRPINLSTARYNQNLSKGALIIEVGATGNTMEECLGSMKYLASVIDAVMQE